MRGKDVVQEWEWHGRDAGVPHSVFGTGEGARHFGLSRANFMFHAHTALAMEKISRLDEIACYITEWEFEFAPVERGKSAMRNVLRGGLAQG